MKASRSTLNWSLYGMTYARGGQDHHPVLPSVCACRAQQRGFPDAGLTPQHQRPAALADAVDQVVEHPELTLAPDQGGCCHVKAMIIRPKQSVQGRHPTVRGPTAAGPGAVRRLCSERRRHWFRDTDRAGRPGQGAAGRWHDQPVGVRPTEGQSPRLNAGSSRAPIRRHHEPAICSSSEVLHMTQGRDHIRSANRDLPVLGVRAAEASRRGRWWCIGTQPEAPFRSPWGHAAG
jgi:hypothetical protein